MAKKKISVTTINPEAITSLDIGGVFYQRLNTLLVDYSEALGKTKFTEAMIKIKHNKVGKDREAYNLETLLILIRDLEQSFKDSGGTIDNEVEVDEQPKT